MNRRTMLAGALALPVSVALAKNAGPQKKGGKRGPKPDGVGRTQGGPVGDTLVVQFDDAQWSDFTPDVLPFIFSLPNLTTMPNYFTTTPLCGPSRASILTGLYAHNHGVRTNDADHHGGYGFMTKEAKQQEISIPLSSVPTVYSAIAGKYINGIDASKKYGAWNYWGAVSDPKYDMAAGYSTDVFRDRILEAVGQCPDGSDFVAFFNPKAPHLPATPANQYQHLHDGEQAPRTPDFDEADLSDKPKFIRQDGQAGSGAIDKIDDITRNRRDTMQSVDDAVKAIYPHLFDPEVYVITDNGFLLLNHSIAGKNVAYNASGRCPALISSSRGNGGTDERIVCNLDWYTTILERYGANVPTNDGANIFSVNRSVLLTEGWNAGPSSENLPNTQSAVPNWKALCYADKRYVSYKTGEEEFYDFSTDPYELDNAADSTDLTPYRQQLSILQDCSGGACIQ